MISEGFCTVVVFAVIEAALKTTDAFWLVFIVIGLAVAAVAFVADGVDSFEALVAVLGRSGIRGFGSGSVFH